MSRRRVLGIAFLVYVFVVLPIATAYIAAQFTIPAFLPGLVRRPRLAVVVPVLLGGLVPAVLAIALHLGCSTHEFNS